MDLNNSTPNNSTTPNDATIETSSTKPSSQVCNRKITKYIIVVAAVCIALTGLLLAWLCIDFRPQQSMEKIGAVYFNEQGFENLNSVPGYPFTFDAPDDLPFIWSIRVNHYGFDVKKHHASGGYSDSYIGNQLDITDGETVYWTKYDNEGVQDPPPAGERIFLEAILYSQETVSHKDNVTKQYIMGYCVIEIFIDDPNGKYSAKMLDSAYYPQQNGKYQNITLEYIREQIEKAKR